MLTPSLARRSFLRPAPAFAFPIWSALLSAPAAAASPEPSPLCPAMREVKASARRSLRQRRYSKSRLTSRSMPAVERRSSPRRLGASRRVLTNLAAAWATFPTRMIATEPGVLKIERDGETLVVRGGRPPARRGCRDGAAPAADPCGVARGRLTPLLLRELPQSAALRPLVRPANVSVVEPAAGPHWVACGDAAATFDPLSGYGLSFAIGTGYAAARAADAFLRGKRLAPVAYQELVADRVYRSWTGLDEAYADTRASGLNGRPAGCPNSDLIIPRDRTFLRP